MSRHLSTRNINFESLELRRLRQDLMFTYKLVGLDVRLRKFIEDTAINCVCPHATHLPVLILSHTFASKMFCHMTPILVRLQVSKVLLAQIFCKVFKGIF